MSIKRAVIAGATAGLLVLAFQAVPVEAATFKNCTALNKVYPGGVAKSVSVRNKGGATKKRPTVNARVYAQHAALDRDKDGIACEK